MKKTLLFLLITVSCFAMEEQSIFEYWGQKKLGENWKEQVTRSFNADYDTFKKICTNLCDSWPNDVRPEGFNRSLVIKCATCHIDKEVTMRCGVVARTLVLHGSIVDMQNTLQTILQRESQKNACEEEFDKLLQITIKEFDGLASKISKLWEVELKISSVIKERLSEFGELELSKDKIDAKVLSEIRKEMNLYWEQR